MFLGICAIDIILLHCQQYFNDTTKPLTLINGYILAVIWDMQVKALLLFLLQQELSQYHNQVCVSPIMWLFSLDLTSLQLNANIHPHVDRSLRKIAT